jgi:hypothetical protein
MKDGLENSFKKALNDFELPYDAQAWESLSQKLSPKRWYQFTSVKWSAALILVAGLTSLFVLQNSEAKKQKELLAKTNQKETTSSATKIEIEQQTPHSIQKNLAQVNVRSVVPEMVMKAPSGDAISELLPHSIPPIFNQMDMLGSTDQAIDYQEPTPSYNGGIAIIDFKNRCQGETLQLEADKRHERMISYAGKELHFSYNEAISLKLTEAGKVTLTANSGPYGQFEEFGSFDVSATPTLNINTDRTLNYEDGLPKISIQAESNEGQITWHSTNILHTNTGKNVELLAFNKGYAIVEVQSTASNGCSAKEKEMIQIPSDYNLLAVNAFNPQSQDSRNSTFMPYALTIRQTPFKLIVLDPDNGGLIFETTDADNAWDGIDRRDGKLVPGNKAYIWKVVLQHPVAGEKGEYRGTIVRM